jgi:hypothetical protein
MAVVVAMFEKYGFDFGMKLEYSNELRPAISTMSDNADASAQMIEYSFS